MKKAERFSIYRHSFVYGNNLIVTKQFIVLNHADGTRTFTDFHRYVENPNKKVKKFNEDGNNRFIFINKYLLFPISRLILAGIFLMPMECMNFLMMTSMFTEEKGP